MIEITLSRTIKVPNSYVHNNKNNIEYELKKGDNFNYYIVKTIEDAKNLYIDISNDNIEPRFVTFPLYVRKKNYEDKVDFLNVFKMIHKETPDALIIRTTVFGKACKIVVDRLQDAIDLKKLENNDIFFCPYIKKESFREKQEFKNQKSDSNIRTTGVTIKRRNNSNDKKDEKNILTQEKNSEEEIEENEEEIEEENEEEIEDTEENKIADI